MNSRLSFILGCLGLALNAQAAEKNLKCEFFIPDGGQLMTVKLDVKLSDASGGWLVDVVENEEHETLVKQLAVRFSKSKLSEIAEADRSELVQFIRSAGMNPTKVDSVELYQGQDFLLADLANSTQQSIGSVGTLITEIGSLPFKCAAQR